MEQLFGGVPAYRQLRCRTGLPQAIPTIGGPETPSQEAAAPSPADAFDLFPNPTPGQFTVVLREADDNARFHALLMTENGVLLESRDINGQRTDFDLSRHSQGMYLLEIEGPNGRETWKIIKR